MGMVRWVWREEEALCPLGPQLHLTALGRFTARSVAGQGSCNLEGGDPGRVGPRRGLGVASRVHVPVSSHLTPSTLSLLPLSDRRMPPSRRNLHLRVTPTRQQPENLVPFPCLGIPSDGPLPCPDPDSPHHLAQKGSPPPQGSRQTRLLCPSSERWLPRHHVLQR